MDDLQAIVAAPTPSDRGPRQIVQAVRHVPAIGPVTLNRRDPA